MGWLGGPLLYAKRRAALGPNLGPPFYRKRVPQGLFPSSAPGTLDCDCPARPNRQTQNAQVHFWFLVGLLAVLADRILKPFLWTKTLGQRTLFWVCVMDQKLGHVFVILWPCIKGPKTHGSKNGFAKMGRERRRRSQNWSVKWPQMWAASAAVKTICATASHPQPRHKALSEDLPGQDAHGRGTSVGNAFSVSTWTLIWARASVPPSSYFQQPNKQEHCQAMRTYSKTRP